MEGGDHAGRTAKSAGVKIVKMNFSDDDLHQARLQRLAEIKSECEKQTPSDVVFLSELSGLLNLNVNTISTRSKKLGITLYLKNRGGQNNKKSLCISADDAEKLIRSHYEGRHQ